jgi:hypothetical protein
MANRLISKMIPDISPSVAIAASNPMREII